MATPFSPSPYPVTPDDRYFVVRGRLWRMANPELPEEERTRHDPDPLRQANPASRHDDLDGCASLEF
jgi:hypothetical protein